MFFLLLFSYTKRRTVQFSSIQKLVEVIYNFVLGALVLHINDSSTITRSTKYKFTHYYKTMILAFLFF